MLEHVRITTAATLTAYQVARRNVLSHCTALLRLPAPPPYRTPARDYVAFHAWRPGWLELDAAGVAALGAGRPSDAVAAELAARGWTSAGTVDLDAVVQRTGTDFPALQNPRELRRFLDVVAARRPRTVVEIGTAAGGLFYAVAQVAAPDATLVSIDRFASPGDDAVCDLLPAFASRAQAVHVLRGSSLSRWMRDELAAVLAGRAIDLLFIDGDHAYGAVRSDFEMYAPLVAPGGLVAMHDVAVFPHNSGRDFEAGLFWRELAASRPTTTIVDEDGVPGICSQLHLPESARRPAAFGIGLVTV